MKKTKFKVDEEVHYMEDNKPKSGVVTGIIMKQGKGEGIHDKFDVAEGEIEITYAISGHYYSIKEVDAFPSVESLRDSVFKITKNV